jgi:hypothetical protein
MVGWLSASICKRDRDKTDILAQCQDRYCLCEWLLNASHIRSFQSFYIFSQASSVSSFGVRVCLVLGRCRAGRKVMRVENFPGDTAFVCLAVSGARFFDICHYGFVKLLIHPYVNVP